MTILRTPCLPAALGALEVGAPAISNVTRVVGADGKLHTLPDTTPSCATIVACLTVPLLANDGVTVLGRIAP